MRDPNEVRRDLDKARGDLTHHVEELKEVVEGELEKPKQVIEKTKHVVEDAKKPFAWLDRHAVIATMSALVLGAAVRVLQLVVHHRRKRHWLLMLHD